MSRHTTIILIFLLITTICFGFEPKISFKFGGGIGYQIDKGTYESHVATSEFPNVSEYDQPDGMILMLNTGIEFMPVSFLKIQPEIRLLAKLTQDLNDYLTTTSLFGGGTVTLFNHFYVGYYYGATEYQWIVFALFDDNFTEEVTHMFLIGYQWRDFFAELIYQHGEGVNRIETAEEYDYGKANTESFSLIVGYNFNILMN